MDRPEPASSTSQDTASAAAVALPMAYVRPVMTNKGKSFVVCSADGMPLGYFPTEDAAFYAAKQGELEPVVVH